MSAPVASTEIDKLAEFNGEVATVVEQARAIEIRTPDEAAFATAFLSRVAVAKRNGETARKFLVDPLNAHVKRINAQFKADAAPLDEADQLVRSKVLTYQRQAEEAARAEQARLDAERLAAEEAAEAERRRLAAEAAEREREAAEAEARRQAEIAAEQDEHRKRIASLDENTLKGIVLGEVTDTDEEQAWAEEELSSRAAARAAQEAAAKARQEAEEAQQAEIRTKSAPALQTAAVAPLAGGNGSASVRKEWKATVVDRSLLPDEYLIVDEKKIRAVVKAGVREIPGVLIEQVEGLSVRAGR